MTRLGGRSLIRKFAIDHIARSELIRKALGSCVKISVTLRAVGKTVLGPLSSPFTTFAAPPTPNSMFVIPVHQGTYTIQLPAKTSALFDEFIRANGMIGQTQLSTGVLTTCKFLNKIASPFKRGAEIIHQFHPLIRFIASFHAEKSESSYPWVALNLKLNQAKQVVPGNYFFVLRRWSFEGVKSEEFLASSVYDIGRRIYLERDDADEFINAIRLNGTDWLEAAHSLDPIQAAHHLDQLEDRLNDEYLSAVCKKKNENKDRAMFQLHGINQHLENRVAKMKATKETHELFKRAGLVKATQARIDKLTARLEMKREQVRRQEMVTPNSDFVCCGIVKVVGD